MSYRHPRYHPAPECPTFVYAVLVAALSLPAVVIILGTAIRAANSAPITRNGEFCPVGYYRTSAYCMPLQSTTPPAVPRTTKNCPIGTYTQSDYCVLLERAK